MRFISLKRQALRAEVQKKYNAGERDFSGIDLSELLHFGGYFDEINLRGANLQGVKCGCGLYINANLSKANLEGVNFSRSYLMNANLSGANLKGAKLHADLSGANLSNADLSGADLSGATLRNANLTGITTSETTIFRLNIMPDGSHTFPKDHHYKILEASKFLELYAAGKKNFRFTVMSHADLSGVDLQSIDLSSSKLSYTNFSGANLSGIGTNFSGANFIFCDLKDARISANLTHTKFIHCDLRRVSGFCYSGDTMFINVNLQDDRWSGAGKEFDEYYNVIRRDGVLIHGPTNTLYPVPYLPPDFSY